MLTLVGSISFAQDKHKEKVYSTIHHYRSNISVNNFDGTRSTIFINGNTATLSNADGTESTLEIFGQSSTVIAVDGTRSTIIHNGMTTTILNSDGSELTINHMNNRSTCSTPYGKHTIRHIFGNMKERRFKEEIDILVHTNWFVRKRASESLTEHDVSVKPN